MKTIRIAIGMIFVCATLACSSHDERNRISSAGELGRKQAARLIEESNDPMKMQYLLLEVRSCEQKLRERDYNEAADTYIAAFEEYLKNNNDSLARLIL